MTSESSPTLPFRLDRRTRSARGPDRLRALAVVSSAVEVEADPTRSLLEAIDRLRDRVEYAIAVDDRDPGAVEALADFCGPRGIDLHIGCHQSGPDARDAANAGLPALLGAGCWDLVEASGWSHAATHAGLLGAIGAAALLYTPHHEPPWTTALTADQLANADAIHGRMLARADAVLCASPWERLAFQARTPDRHQCTFLPFGIDFDGRRPGPVDRPARLISIGDPLASPAAFCRVLEVFGRLRADRPDLRLTLIGGTEEAIPDDLRSSCDVRGRLDRESTRRALAESRGLVLLPDHEAAGRLVIEALACGTPVYLNRLFPAESLFGRRAGVHLGPPDDPAGLAAMIGRGLDRGAAPIVEVIAAREGLAREFDASHLAERRWQAMATACFLRSQWARHETRPLARQG